MIILTGSTGGIGKELIGYLSKIDKVIGIYNRSPGNAADGDNIGYEKIDIGDAGDIKSFVERRRSDLLRLTIIHSAVCNIDGLFAAYKEADWDKVMRINLKGNFLLTQALLPQMIQEKWGRIIHISSVVGMKGRVGTVAYSASKTALLGISGVLASEYGRFNITSNILSLGYFESGLADTLSDEAKKEILARIPSKSFGKIRDIAYAVEFLIKSGGVNGSVLTIDGAIQ